MRRVLVLADNLVAGRRIARALSGLPLETHVLLCNNQEAQGYRLGQALVAARHFPLALPSLAWSSLRGRLHVKNVPLEDESVVRWLGEQRFWIGLHAMGVIYRKPVLESFERGLLNAHIGVLPEYRGLPNGVSTYVLAEAIGEASGAQDVIVSGSSGAGRPSRNSHTSRSRRTRSLGSRSCG